MSSLRLRISEWLLDLAIAVEPHRPAPPKPPAPEEPPTFHVHPAATKTANLLRSIAADIDAGVIQSFGLQWPGAPDHVQGRVQLPPSGGDA